MKSVHMIHGYLGSGKTTFALFLERRTGGLRLSLDEWSIGLTQDHVVADYELGDRIIQLLQDLWPRALLAGVDDVILDFGFWSRRWRDETRNLAGSIGAEAILYDVSCPDDVALERCLARRNPESSDYFIDAEAFENLRGRFEPLGADEPAVLIDGQEDPHRFSS